MDEIKTFLIYEQDGDPGMIFYQEEDFIDALLEIIHSAQKENGSNCFCVTVEQSNNNYGS